MDIDLSAMHESTDLWIDNLIDERALQEIDVLTHHPDDLDRSHPEYKPRVPVSVRVSDHSPTLSHTGWGDVSRPVRAAVPTRSSEK